MRFFQESWRARAPSLRLMFTGRWISSSARRPYRDANLTEPVRVKMQLRRPSPTRGQRAHGLPVPAVRPGCVFCPQQENTTESMGLVIKHEQNQFLCKSFVKLYIFGFMKCAYFQNVSRLSGKLMHCYYNILQARLLCFLFIYLLFL